MTWLQRQFEFEYCSECKGDWQDHIDKPDALGKHHAWCITRVVFRMQEGEVVAWMPFEPGTNDPYTCTIYVHNGQHGSGDVSLMMRGRPATPEEYAPLMAELQGKPYGYIVKPVKRVSRSKALETRRRKIA